MTTPARGDSPDAALEQAAKALIETRRDLARARAELKRAAEAEARAERLELEAAQRIEQVAQRMPSAGVLIVTKSSGEAYVIRYETDGSVELTTGRAVNP